MATDITTRPKGWAGIISAFMAGQELVISEWTETGMAYVNGFTRNSNDPTNTLRYRTIKLGGKVVAVQFAGYVITPSISPGGSTVMAKLPSGLLQSGFNHNSDRVAIVQGEIAIIAAGIDSSGGGTLSISNAGDTAKTWAASSVQVNLTQIY